MVLIEDKASGQSLIQDLKRETSTNIIAIKAIKDKVTRFASITPMFESSRIFLKQNYFGCLTMNMNFFHFQTVNMMIRLILLVNF